MTDYRASVKRVEATLQKSNFEPVDTAELQTARNTDELIDLIQSMKEAADKESRAQHWRFVVETILSLFAIAISSVAAFAAIYSLRLALSCG